MKIYLQSCQSALSAFATRNGATTIEEHGTPDQCAASPFLLIFRTETEILHASIHWRGTPFAFADSLAPSFKSDRTEFAYETFACNSTDRQPVLMDHAAATRSYRHRPDLPAKYTEPDGWKSIQGQSYLRKLA